VNLRRRSKNLFLHRGTRGDNNYQTFLAKRPVTNIAIPGTLPATFSGGRLWPEARTAVRRSRGSSDDGGWVPWFPGGRREINHSSSRFRREAVTPPPLVKIHDSGTPNRQGGYPPGMSENPEIWSNSRKPQKMTKTRQIQGGPKTAFFDKCFPGGSKTPPKRKPLPTNMPDLRSFFGVDLPRWEVPK